MISLLDLLKESNDRKKSRKVETPLDLIRLLNKEKKIRTASEKILRRIRGDKI